jgi:2-polyprenyl-3-methyl-5-hydroxy-6-metoxy-1,4-benzoquinol methylase
VVGTAKDALAKLAELAEFDQVKVTAMDLSGTIIELATLQAEANRAPNL